jgi:hypothetical protein
MRKASPRLDKTAPNNKRRPARNVRNIESKVSTMNSKFLYAATVAVSLISTLAMADEAPVSREQVKTELQQAIASGTLKRTDYDFLQPAIAPATSSTSREQIASEFAQDRTERRVLVGADASRDYNPLGTHIFDTSTLARSQVKNEVLQAAANGTLQRNDYDDATSMARKARQHAAAIVYAQKVKAKLHHDAS